MTSQYIERREIVRETGCSVRDCGRVVLALGVCAHHYYGAPDKRAACAAGDCDRQAHRRGLCTTHYRVWRLAVAAPCSVEECERPAVDSGMCGLHVQRVRKSGSAGEASSRLRSTNGVCGEDGCELKIFTRGLCRSHYLAHGLPCSVEGCDKPVVARKLCGMHYARLVKTGDPGEALPRRIRAAAPVAPEPVADPRVCSIDGCERPIWSRGLCGMHYQRRRAYGDANRVPPRWERRPCAVEGCEERARDLGRCPRHAAKFRRDRRRTLKIPSPETMIALAEAGEAARRWRAEAEEVLGCRQDRNDLVRTFALTAGEPASARLAAAAGVRQSTLRQILAQPVERPERLGEWRRLLADLTATGASIARCADPAELGELARLRQRLCLWLLEGVGRLSERLAEAMDAELNARGKRDQLIAECWRSGVQNLSLIERRTGLSQATVYKALREHGINPPDIRR
ncbi:hypothetical protein [Acrocarpospora catenulata]|uniref:hypothetical protein n=1 Tax=Acrocarpospora catenulata TaxID=2836182 RepID=UPI001BDB6209|nr:hypothetical protein [Acrocarpospora catenulata]